MVFLPKFNVKTASIAVILMVSFLYMAFFVPELVHKVEPSECIIDGECQHEQFISFLTILLPVMLAAGISVGAVVYYFMTGKTEKIESRLRFETNLLLKFLSKEERLVVERLVQEKGKALQAEISRIEGLGKVRSHRILRRLEDRGVIKLESFGKTNIVRFTNGISKGIWPEE